MSGKGCDREAATRSVPTDSAGQTQLPRVKRRVHPPLRMSRIRHLHAACLRKGLLATRQSKHDSTGSGSLSAGSSLTPTAVALIRTVASSCRHRGLSVASSPEYSTSRLGQVQIPVLCKSSQSPLPRHFAARGSPSITHLIRSNWPRNRPRNQVQHSIQSQRSRPPPVSITTTINYQCSPN